MKSKADGDSPAQISDHPFTPEAERLGVKLPWYGLCGHTARDAGGQAVKCGLAESAHVATLVKRIGLARRVQ